MDYQQNKFLIISHVGSMAKQVLNVFQTLVHLDETSARWKLANLNIKTNLVSIRFGQNLLKMGKVRFINISYEGEKLIFPS